MFLVYWKSPYVTTDMSKHRLFYSTKCRHCQAFLEELSRTPFVPEFQLICVDPSPNRPPLPGWLKSVPSMLVAGESTPRVGPGPVNNWLFERKLGGGAGVTARSNAMEDRSIPITPPVYSPDTAPRPTANTRGSSGARAAPPPMSGSAPAGPAPIGGGGDGPEAYHLSEMGSMKWSDNYSFIGSDFSSDKGYDPISRNFESLIGPGAVSGGSVGGKTQAAPQSRASAKAEALNREFEAFTASRDNDMPQPRGRM